MYYLKCNSCGHLNKVENENLLFCSKCNKKLENNFRDWQRKNSENSFTDFKKLVCISEQEIPASNVKRGIKSRKSLKYWVGFAITFTMISIFGKIGGEKLFNLLRSEKTSQEILSQEWIKKTYGNYGLIVETPVIMTEMEVPLPDKVKEVIAEMQAFQYNSAKGFKVFISSVKYNLYLQEGNLQDGANGSVNELRMQKGVTDFTYNEAKVNLNGIAGFKQTGSFKLDGIPVEFINAVYGQGYNAWQIMVAYEVVDEVGKVAAKRVIESIKIENY